MSGAGGETLLPGLDVSRETSRRLQQHEDLLRRWTGRINLIAPGTLADIRGRHIRDSAQLFPFLPRQGTILDLGSGAGFPGLVCAIIAAEHAPAARYVLVESDRRKAAFLARVVAETGLPASIRPERVESLPPAGAAAVTARALAPLDRLLPLAHRHLAPEGWAVLPKGAGHAQEVGAARRDWRFSLTAHPSITAPTGAILVVRDLTRA